VKKQTKNFGIKSWHGQYYGVLEVFLAALPLWQ
jgi:hypothetical protein